MDTTLLQATIRAKMQERMSAAGAPEGTDGPFHVLIDAVAAVLQDGKITQADYPAVVAAATTLYDEVCATVDIPGVPAIVEKAAEAVLRRLIEPGVKALFEHFVPA